MKLSSLGVVGTTASMKDKMSTSDLVALANGVHRKTISSTTDTTLGAVTEILHLLVSRINGQEGFTQMSSHHAASVSTQPKVKMSFLAMATSARERT